MRPTDPVGASRRRLVEAAEAFVRARLPSPVTIEHLCRVTGVSERTLRNAFHDARGMSPKRALLCARLGEAREALKRRRGLTTVTMVATDHGFYELGRFACRYKALFGESPSDTLRKHDGGADADPDQCLPA